MIDSEPNSHTGCNVPRFGNPLEKRPYRDGKIEKNVIQDI